MIYFYRTGKKISWLTNKLYDSEEVLRKDLAIHTSWGNITSYSKFNVPAGTWVSEGRAASQGVGFEGGGYQGVIDWVRDSWIQNTKPAFQ